MDSRDQVYMIPLLEDDNSQENTKEYTGDGSVCIFGHPALKEHTGNWKACSLTLVCFFCSYMAFSSIGKNLVSYLTKSLHETNVAAARNVSTWQGTSYLAPLVGAFIADSYLGKYWTALIFCTIFITGLLLCGYKTMRAGSGVSPLLHYLWLWVQVLFSWALLCIDFRNLLEEALLQEYARLLLRLLTTSIKTCHAIARFFMRFRGKVHQSKEAGNWSIQMDLSSLIKLQL